MIGETDVSLITRSLREPECFEAIFDRHFRRLLAYLRRRVGGELASELAAETFERAFRDRSRFVAADGSALPWLYGIAGNLLRMHWRSEERRLRAFAREAQYCRSQTEDVVLNQVAGLEPVLVDAIAALSRSLREVLLLHAWGELSAEEIAIATGLTPAAVRTRLHRARTQVGERLGLGTETEEIQVGRANDPD